MNDVLLSVQDLEVRFDTYAGKVYAVNSMTFDIRKGEMFGLVGESGCGKTITGMCIIRMLPRGGKITKGRILLSIMGKATKRIQTMKIKEETL